MFIGSVDLSNSLSYIFTHFYKNLHILFIKKATNLFRGLISPDKYIVYQKLIYMFKILSIMFIGIGIGYLFRKISILQKTEKTISITILLLLFMLGISVGSNELIIKNIGKFGWQAIIISSLSLIGSLIATSLIVKLAKKGDRK